MTRRVLTVKTRDGAPDLRRVAHGPAPVSADLVPLHSVRTTEHLALRVRLDASERVAHLCLARLLAWPCVASAVLEAPPVEAPL